MTTAGVRSYFRGYYLTSCGGTDWAACVSTKPGTIQFGWVTYAPATANDLMVDPERGRPRTWDYESFVVEPRVPETFDVLGFG